MLAEGKISADDAERLLKAVSSRSDGAIGTEARERVEVRVEPPIENREPDEREDAFTVGESPRLVVDVDKGRVAVGVGPPGEIRVRATTGGPSRVAYEVSQHGDEVRVSARKKSRKLLFGFVDLGRYGRVNIEVTTPAATDVNARLVAGPMVLVGVGGASSLHTVGGTHFGRGCERYAGRRRGHGAGDGRSISRVGQAQIDDRQDRRKEVER